MEKTYDSHISTLNYSNFNDSEFTQQYNDEYSRRVLPVTVIFSLTAVLGFVSNAIVVYVYGFKYKQCNFKYFMFVMGVIGLVQCSIMLPTQAAEMHYWFVFPETWLCRVSAYVFGYTVIACYFVLLLISIDRFRKVCRPHDWQINSNTARNLCILVSIAALVFALPPGIISGHHQFLTSYNGRYITVTVCATDDMYQNRDWAVYFLLLSGGFPVSVVIIVTCVLYGMILKQFYQGKGSQIQRIYKNASTQLPVDNSAIESYPRTSAIESYPRTPILVRVPNNVPIWTQKLKNGDSFKNSSKSRKGRGLRKSGSVISRRRGVRNKIMRNTLISLIITISCIVAIILTFCLHIIAEDINRNALSVSHVKLLFFVIFHRGSFSIICAVFPILYSIRDMTFRRAILKLFTNSAQSAKTTAKTVPSTNEDSKY